MKAIKIDVEKKEVYFVEIDKKDELKSIYKHLGANMFEVALTLRGQNDMVYVDEEGLLKPKNKIPGWFMIEGQPQPLAGHGLVVGCNPNTGASRDVKCTIEFIQGVVQFLEK